MKKTTELTHLLRQWNYWSKKHEQAKTAKESDRIMAKGLPVLARILEILENKGKK